MAATKTAKTKKMEAPTNQKLQRVALVIDESGSMRFKEAGVNSTYDSWISTIKDENNKNNMQTEVTILKFDSTMKPVARNIDINSKFPALNYKPDAMTALISAVRWACDNISSNYPEMSYLVIVITDGAENSLKGEDKIWFSKAIRQLQDTDRWTFAFLVPDEGGVNYLKQFGVPEGNIRIWATTDEGLRTARIETQSSLQSYYTGRAGGQSATRGFFKPVTSDLSKMKKSDIKAMNDVTTLFKLHTCEKENNIKDFVEVVSKKPYFKGCAFYQLMKPEKVQHYKEVLLYHKTTKHVYGGNEARLAIGLQDWQDAKVTPGNHSDYDIFVQSTSTNRILPRGTKVMVKL